ncbi:MAG TPA: hypothetical protein VGV09_07710 [Steroidobacteraceae bacterium]|nr:hypothetical protein [Steroidobacteraceae bacterium]
MRNSARAVRRQENPNVNCLKGMQCPSCWDFGPFEITATQSGKVRVHDEGADLILGSPVWVSTATCQCCACGYEGTVGAFRGEVPPRFDSYQRVTLGAFEQGQFKNTMPSEVPATDGSLLQFLLRELSEAQGCYSFGCAAQRVNIAIHELVAVRDAFVRAALNR